MTTTVPVERKILSENDRIAAGLRGAFEQRGLLCLNLISAPGSGKTALLERTLTGLAGGTRAAVLTGDLQTDNDARRIARAGFPVKQITTGGTCHLDASMIARALDDWNLDELDLLFIENVGNLVCPTSFDLGEHAKVVLLSVTEGEDKPEKYPGIYRRASLSLITKADLLPYVDFDLARTQALTQAVHPGLRQILVSCRTGQGMDEWQAWIASQRAFARAAEVR
jgi:hydrogenase nickel incorporation protein HypB